ncbi:BMC domain-containing protein [Loigolactobacillus zhaoyuanensis]|uniref:BMC domain-containing protein n=1 Tax=Loigolactobacillus zhaoyuanensis TaxID=2486017 RepID=A0ABW8UD05_9LACO
MDALGMIETKGMLAAIEASDVMLKTAEVTIVSQEKVGGGLVATLVAGDVAAVKTSVDAASTAVKRLSTESLFVTDVIPRPDKMLKNIIFDDKIESENSTKEQALDDSKPVVDNKVSVVERQIVKEATTPDSKSIGKINENHLMTVIADNTAAEKYLNGFKINDLRSLVRSQPGLAADKKNFYQLSKENIIKELIKYYRSKK